MSGFLLPSRYIFVVFFHTSYTKMCSEYNTIHTVITRGVVSIVKASVVSPSVVATNRMLTAKEEKGGKSEIKS